MRPKLVDQQPDKGLDATRTPRTVIEEIGFGHSQVKALLMAGVVQFSQGVHLCLVSVLASPMAHELNINHNQKALFTTAVFMGMLVGTLLSGHFGDSVGRRYPIAASSGIIIVVGCVTPLLSSYACLLLARLFLGIGIGLGFPPSVALLSELTPNNWRIAVRSMTDCLFDVGYTFAALMVSISDPALQALGWRRIMWSSTIAPSILGLITIVFLPESPVYLAAAGRHEEAHASLESMKQMNSAEGVDTSYFKVSPDGPLECVCDKPVRPSDSVSEQICIVVSRRYRIVLCALSFTSFIANIFYYGGLYAQPQVMTKSGRSLEPGWELVIGGGPADVLGLVLVVFVAKKFPLKAVMTSAMVLAAIVCFCFGFAGKDTHRNAIAESVYQFGIFGFYWVPAVSFVVLWQLAVEVFPTRAATTGCSVAMALGRVGGLIAPLLFENFWFFFHRWEVFCYIVSAGCAVSALLVGLIPMPPADQYEAQPLRSCSA